MLVGHDSLVMENVGPKTSPWKEQQDYTICLQNNKILYHNIYNIIVQATGSLSCEEISLVIKATDIVISVLIIKVSV